jgi:hypothetical protein
VRKYTEPVAEYNAAVLPDTTYKSWILEGTPGAFPVYHWVDCEGFKELRIHAIGNGDFNIRPYFFPEGAPAAGDPDPTYLQLLSFAAVLIDAPTPGRHGVIQTVNLSGAKAVGIEIVIPVANGEATHLSLRAFLL